MSRQVEFLDFCREGRLAGTRQNLEAIRFLARSLEREGYTVHEYVDRRRALLPLAYAFGSVALGIVYRIVTGELSFLVLAALMVWPLARAAYHIWRGTPLAVIGVRRTVATGQPTPTVILGAHLDSASIPVRGSFLTMNLVVVLYLAGLLAVGELISPAAAVCAAALSGALGFGNASPGGDDNASGVFAVLDCIGRLGDTPDLNVVPVFFNFEEQGLIGSAAFFRRFLARRGSGIPGIEVDSERAYMINFDCVGRGKRIFVSGNKRLRTAILNTQAAKELGASATSLYTSDHLAFGKPWQSVSFARADRHWMFDLAWLHSRADVPEKVSLSYIDEVSRITEESIRELARSAGPSL